MPSKMKFHRVGYIDADIYVASKRVCADDISGASCHQHSDWIRQVTTAFPYDQFTRYLHFEISLIPPGGTINILAESYSLEMDGQWVT